MPNGRWRTSWVRHQRQRPALVKAGNWLSHLEYDWDNPVWRPFLLKLSKNHRLIRYDPRGTGLSDWDVADISLDAWANDLATVVDAAGVEHFPLFGLSQGCAVSIAYAVRHPERVSHLILCGGFALGGHRRSPEESERRAALETLMRFQWGADNPAIRQIFTTLLLPGANKEQADTFNELQQRTTSVDCAARYFKTVGMIDVTGLLPQVSVPTLVLHAREDAMAPFEAGRQMAAGISGARFVALQSKNHVPLEQDPATHRLFEELELFLK